MTEDNQPFSFSHHVDIHALDWRADISSLPAIAHEHGFRGIVVPQGRIEKLAKLCEDNKVVPVAAIDYPHGHSSPEVRTYSIVTAQEKGAKEVEVVVPYHLIHDREFKKFDKDVQTVMGSCEKLDIRLRFVLNKGFIPDDAKINNRIFRIFSSNKVRRVSTGLDHNSSNTTESVMWTRDIRKKTNAQVKAFVDTDDPKDFSQFPKAGCNLIGLDWRMAANAIHGYEGMVNQGEEGAR